jgi:hypothetical protein
MDQHFPTHETGHHTSKEYVRDDVHTNSAEGYFSIFKRGMRGIYQHCGEKHLHSYLAEFDFRYDQPSQARLTMMGNVQHLPSRARKPNSVVVSTT